MPEWVAATISTMPLSPIAATAFMSPASTDLKGSLIFFRMLVRLLPHLVDGEDELVVHRLLDPQGAVVVERGEAVLGLDVIRSTLFGDTRHIIEDRLLRRAVVPGRQRIFRRVTVRRDAERQHQNCAGKVLHPLHNHTSSYWR